MSKKEDSWAADASDFQELTPVQTHLQQVVLKHQYMREMLQDIWVHEQLMIMPGRSPGTKRGI